MTIEEIKRIIGKDGGKVVIVEEGKPTMVIMGFGDYEKKLTPLNFTKQNLDEGKLVSFSNFKKELPKELQEEELKIEDLPI